MSFYRDKQIRGYGLFLFLFSFLLLSMLSAFHIIQRNQMKALYIAQNERIVSALLEQGVSKEVAANALMSTKTSEAGKNLLDMVGVHAQAANDALPVFSEFQQSLFWVSISIAVFLIFLLFSGTALFFGKRKKLYVQANQVIDNYIGGDFSEHLPQNGEGAVFQLFSAIERLATMLQSKNEMEHQTKEFLKNTISDISHQFKTPLAALAMYQEIIESEPDNIETVKAFSSKIGTSLSRMEQLIQSMLKITRLDAGNIIFEKKSHLVEEIVRDSINELTTRAKNENKKILITGDFEEQLICDRQWTSEAIGNIVKNALDHTGAGGTIRITWEHTPVMLRILISDDGDGIAPADIYHIWKRFYRSKYTLKTAGIGLGLPLAKSIVEGQGGTISVRSTLGQGTIFTLSFLTES